MRRLTPISIVGTLALVSAVVFAQEVSAPAEIEAAIEALEAQYTEGWNAGDASACAAIYTEDGETIDPYGNTHRGRAAIETNLAETLETYSGSTITLTRTSLYVVTDDVVVSDGTWEVTGSTAEGAATEGFYTVIATKTGDEWLLTTGQSKVAPEIPTE